MKVGFIGLGKLGTPVSVAMALGGHEVYAYEYVRERREGLREGKAGVFEPDIDRQLARALKRNLRIVDSPTEAAFRAEIVFVAVQTPTKPDNSFDTSFLTSAVSEIGTANRIVDRFQAVAVISTVLPMTVRHEVLPALEAASGKRVGKDVGLVYNPSFIAMGTTIEDFLKCEFVLIGESDRRTGRMMDAFYSTLIDRATPRLHTTWENAEITKMSYNTFIGMKIMIANQIGELCHKVPHADADFVSDAISLAKFRIASSKYMRAGLGDGGECHPRDNLALSYLAKKLALSYDPFGMVMEGRERHARMIANQLLRTNLPIVILGARYKPKTDLLSYSSPLQVAEILVREFNVEPAIYDPFVSQKSKKLFSYERDMSPYFVGELPDRPSAFLLGVNDPQWSSSLAFPAGSVVLDPWRMFSERKSTELSKAGSRYIPFGIGAKA